MAYTLVFTFTPRLRARRPDISPQAAPQTIPSRARGSFRWMIDPASGQLVCRFLGAETDSDPLSCLRIAA